MLLKNTILLSIFFLAINLHIYSQNDITSTFKDSITTIKPNYLIGNVTDSVINYGKLFLNTPYRYGSKGASSFDCSGFTSYVYRNFGINLPRTSSDQAEHLPSVELKDIKSGDLVFFNGRRRNKSVGHVGIVVATKEDGEFDFIHASVHDGVIISNSKTDYYHKRFVKAGRVFLNDSLICLKANANSVNRTDYVNAFPNEQIKKTIPAKFHFVKKGETLSSIANKYDLTLSSLKKKNGLHNNIIKPKQKLIIKNEEVISISQPLFAENKKQLTDSLKINSFSNDNIDLKNSEISTHKVKKGESLYSISKIYNIDESKLKTINNLTSSKILLGQVLALTDKGEIQNDNLAINNTETDKMSLPQNDAKNLTANSTHKTTKGESLHSIAKLYNMSVSELIELNHLTSSHIQVGHELLIKGIQITKIKPEVKRNIAVKTHKVESGETLSSIAAKYGCKINEIKNWNDKSSNKISIGEKLIIRNS